MRTITKALRAHKTWLYLIAGAVVLGFTLVSCGGGGGYGGGGAGMVALPPAAFGLSMPANGAMGVGTTPTLTWSASLYAAEYTVQISPSNTFAAMAVDTNVSGTSFAVTVPLKPATTYFWRVRASNIYGGQMEGPFSFTT